MTPEKAPTSLESFVAQADNTRLQSCEDFRRKWTPTEFCTLPSPERRTILRGLLTTSEPISSEPVNGGYNFATEYTPIHEAMPLLYGYGTNKQIAQEAREVFYQVSTIQSGLSVDDGTLDIGFAEQHVRLPLSLASSRTFRSGQHVDPG